MKQRVIIMGAAGRDFHNFNVHFRDDPQYEVVAFTATQIPDIAGRMYPPELAGRLYPDGIPIEHEDDLERLIREKKADLVVFAYSDVTNQHVMERSARVNAAGADFLLMGTGSTMIKSKRPLVSITAVRTGSGKSQTTRRVCHILKRRGRKVAVIRHPMPYGDLVKQEWQRFETYADLDRHHCTIEEREEYEPHIESGTIVYAGVDYEKILRKAEAEADVVVWDGGNNDFSFYRPDLSIVVADPHRAGHELLYYPSAVNVRTADVVVINKVDTACLEDIHFVRENVSALNPRAWIVEAASPILVDDPGCHSWPASSGHRRRSHAHARRDGVRSRHDCRAAIRGPRDRGPAALRGRLNRRDVRDVPQDRPAPPGDGLREGTDPGPAKTVDAVDCEGIVIGTPIDLCTACDVPRAGHARALRAPGDWLSDA